jgi:phosphoribosylaminoimidazole (AIR) synthetase
MYRTFNMGIGLVIVVSPAGIAGTLDSLTKAGEVGAAVIGRVVGGCQGVSYIGAEDR